jgi:NADP-dependent 3-hydroxy acid dehydrogenase YdfG
MRGDTEKANAFFEKFPGSLDPTDVADAVMYAVSRPQHVCIQQIVVTPWFQW